MQRPAESYPPWVLVGLITTCMIGQIDGKRKAFGVEFRQRDTDVRKSVEKAHGNLPVLPKFGSIWRIRCKVTPSFEVNPKS